MMFKRIFNKMFPRAATTQSLTPMQVAKAYNFPTGLNVSGFKIAVIELGGGYNQNDVSAYCDKYGITRPTFSPVLIDGATNTENGVNGADGEESLDYCVIAGAAPGVEIIPIICPNTDQGFIDGFKMALTLKVDAVACSWGEYEGAWEQTSMTAMDSVLAELKAALIPVFVAAGDNGSSDGASGNNVDYPGSSPYAISCGGTTLSVNSLGAISSETAWSWDANQESGGGGGISTIYTKPSFQSAVTLSSMRMVPDVAGNANPDTGYLIEIDGQEGEMVGGTSAVAPLFAALAVLIKASTEKAIDWQTFIYNNPTCFNDITSGNNGAYSCTPGYDLVTGWGSPDASKMLTALGVTTPAPPVTTTPPPVVTTPPVKKEGFWQWLESLFSWL